MMIRGIWRYYGDGEGMPPPGPRSVAAVLLIAAWVAGLLVLLVLWLRLA